jgi:hypothetical protein
MLIHSLFLSALAVHPLIKPTIALPASVYREDGSVEIQFNHSIKEGSIVPKSVALLEFKGCTPDMKDALTAAWINMVDMGSKIKGNVEFNEAVSSLPQSHHPRWRVKELIEPNSNTGCG